MRNAICRICGDAGPKKLYMVKEMMFGMRDEFEYFECGSCGCLQIADIPRDISKYYPSKYSSFRVPEFAKKAIRDNFIMRYLRHKRTEYILGRKGIIGMLASTIRPAGKTLSEHLGWLKECGADLDSKILDVGCGNGNLLLELSWYGFKDLTGVDLYIKGDIAYANGVRIFKRDLYGMESPYDMVMFHHSFEHMADPIVVLQKARKLLAPHGYVLVRIPTVSSYAWTVYGVNWAQIDAPRHFFLHSLKSIGLAADKAGLRIKKILFDSNDFQFRGSEQYKRGIPLFDERSYYINARNSVFSEEEVRSFVAKADELNRNKTGDAICVYMMKKENAKNAVTEKVIDGV